MSARNESGDLIAVRVLRTCPRCHERNYHHANRTIGQPKIRLKCACGMEWRGRYRKDEWV